MVHSSSPPLHRSTPSPDRSTAVSAAEGAAGTKTPRIQPAESFPSPGDTPIPRFPIPDGGNSGSSVITAVPDVPLAGAPSADPSSTPPGARALPSRPPGPHRAAPARGTSLLRAARSWAGRLTASGPGPEAGPRESGRGPRRSSWTASTSPYAFSRSPPERNPSLTRRTPDGSRTRSTRRALELPRVARPADRAPGARAEQWRSALHPRLGRGRRTGPAADPVERVAMSHSRTGRPERPSGRGG